MTIHIETIVKESVVFTWIEGGEGGGLNGELFLASYFKASYFGELFLCKLDDLK